MANGKRGNGNKGPQRAKPEPRTIPTYPKNLSPHQKFLISRETWQRLWREKFASKTARKPDLIYDLTKKYVNDGPAVLKKRREELAREHHDMLLRVKSIEKEIDRALQEKNPKVERVIALLSKKYFLQKTINTITRHDLVMQLILYQKTQKTTDAEIISEIHREINDTENLEKFLSWIRSSRIRLYEIAQIVIGSRK